jgi:thioredoxin-like negative regulator of GroEL
MNKEVMLSEILAQNPKDTFARYGLAMEYAGTDRIEASLEQFEILLTENPDYTPGYFMAAQTLARAGRGEEAKQRLTQGIASADRTGNQHAKGEMQAMLEELNFQS